VATDRGRHPVHASAVNRGKRGVANSAANGKEWNERKREKELSVNRVRASPPGCMVKEGGGGARAGGETIKLD